MGPSIWGMSVSTVSGMTTFVGGASGDWRVLSISPVKGEGLALVPHLAILDETAIVPATDSVTGASGVRWVLRGVRSYLRYVERAEKSRLDEASPPLGRPEATRAALIPIRKSAAWWISRRTNGARFSRPARTTSPIR